MITNTMVWELSRWFATEKRYEVKESYSHNILSINHIIVLCTRMSLHNNIKSSLTCNTLEGKQEQEDCSN